MARRTRLLSYVSDALNGAVGASDDDYAVTSRWEIARKGGVTMPGKGKVMTRQM